MFAISDESNGRLIKWLDVTRRAIGRTLKADELEELDALIAELENADTVPDLEKMERRITALTEIKDTVSHCLSKGDPTYFIDGSRGIKVLVSDTTAERMSKLMRSLETPPYHSAPAEDTETDAPDYEGMPGYGHCDTCLYFDDPVTIGSPCASCDTIGNKGEFRWRPMGAETTA